jgi:hypothetical protein
MGKNNVSPAGITNSVETRTNIPGTMMPIKNAGITNTNRQFHWKSEELALVWVLLTDCPQLRQYWSSSEGYLVPQLPQKG